MVKLDYAFLDRFHRLGAEDGKEFGMPPSAKLASLVRPAIVARPGKTLVWCDWSAIEARVLPWLAASRGAEKKLDIFRENDKDPSLPDVYKHTASDMLDGAKAPHEITDEERQTFGKVPELSLGFGGAEGALMAMASNYRVYVAPETATRMVAKWRDNNKWARAFWGAHGKDGSYGLWGAANSAMEQPGEVKTAGRVAYMYDPDYMRGTLLCALPCGRTLTYPRIRWEKRLVEDRKTKELVERYQLTFRKGYGRSALWYGKLAENVTQAFAASILRATLVALRAEEDWMPAVGHTHDEIVTEVDTALVRDAKSVLMEYFLDGFEWTEGLPLAAEATSSWFYTKSKYVGT